MPPDDEILSREVITATALHLAFHRLSPNQSERKKRAIAKLLGQLIGIPDDYETDGKS